MSAKQIQASDLIYMMISPQWKEKRDWDEREKEMRGISRWMLETYRNCAYVRISIYADVCERE